MICANFLKTINPSSNLRGSDFEREQYLYLTTWGRNSGLLREIEIWFTHRDGRFYVIAEYATSQWVQNVRANPEVKVRVAGLLLPRKRGLFPLRRDPTCTVSSRSFREKSTAGARDWLWS